MTLHTPSTSRTSKGERLLRPTVHARFGTIATLVLVTAVGGCSGNSDSSSAPNIATGGTNAVGTPPLGTGGATAQSGTVVSGGSVASGGRTGTGTPLTSGGISPTSGGPQATGGNSALGGVSSTSDPATTGGTPTSGGTTASSGTKTTGGTTSTGGTRTTGGTTSNGGVNACGVVGAAGATTGTPLAFPGAQGFGKNATGARTGTVYHVTNLNDSGTGSFRDAVSASGRFVVFDVGGYIQLKTAVSAKSNLTIAGQTAPGEGIGFRGGEISFAKSSNVICRYLRVRPGSETASNTDDALSLYLAKNVMIDHSSFEFAPWNNIGAVSDDWQNYPMTDVTIQDSLIANPTYQQFGAHVESVSSQIAWYRNIFANSHNRNPLDKINDVFVNNLLYNYSAGYTTHTSTNFKHDIVNNYFVMGPASAGTDNTWFQIDKNQSIYYSGNLKDTNVNGTLDGATTTPYWYQGEGTVLTSAWSTETATTAPLSAASAARVTMSLAGTLPRDAMDALIISQVMTLGKGTTGTGANTAGPGGGLYTDQTQTGLSNNGYGSITGGTKPTDTDNDGMPDHWEKAFGSNPNTNDAMTKTSDGYAFIEHYVNWLAGPHATTTVGVAVDIDLAPYALGFSKVSPSYTVGGAQNGTVTLGTDGHTAHLVPASGCRGLSSFNFTVKGSDGTAYTNQVAVLVVP